MTMKNLREGMIVLNKINKEQYEICAVSEGLAQAKKMGDGNEILDITEQNAICFKLLACPEGPTGYNIKEGVVVSPTGVAVQMGEIKPIKVLADTNSCLVFLAEDKDAGDGGKRARVMTYNPRHESFRGDYTGISETPQVVAGTGDIVIIVSDTTKEVRIPAEKEGDPDIVKQEADECKVLRIDKADGYVGIVDEVAAPIGKMVGKKIVVDGNVTTNDLLFLSEIVTDSDGYLETAESGGLLTVIRIIETVDEDEDRIRTTVELRESVRIKGAILSAEFDTEAVKSLLIRTDQEIVFMNSRYEPVVVDDPAVLAKIPESYKYLVASQVRDSKNNFRLTVADENLNVLTVKTENTSDRGKVTTVTKPET